MVLVYQMKREDLFIGGYGDDVFAPVNTIDYVTIASTGNGQEFGDIQSSKNVFNMQILEIQQEEFLLVDTM